MDPELVKTGCWPDGDLFEDFKKKLQTLKKLKNKEIRDSIEQKKS